MEGIRMVDEWPIIEKKIPSMDMVFRPVVEASNIEIGHEEESGSLADAKRVAPASGKVRLSAFEEQIFRRVDGSRTVQAIIDATGVSEFEVCRTLFDLLNRNLITTVGRGTAREMELGAPSRAPSETPAYVAAALVLVLSLVSVVVRRHNPFAVVGRPSMLQESYDVLLSGVVRTRLERLDRAVMAYQLLRGSLPATLEEVATRGLVDPAFLKDPSARPFHYAHTQDGYLLSAVDDAGRPQPGTIIERTVPPEQRQ
jgi:hypothetical protein